MIKVDEFQPREWGDGLVSLRVFWEGEVWGIEETELRGLGGLQR